MESGRKNNKKFKLINKSTTCSSSTSSTMTLSGGKIFRPWDEQQSAHQHLNQNQYSDEKCVEKVKDDSSSNHVKGKLSREERKRKKMSPCSSGQSLEKPTRTEHGDEGLELKFPLFSSHNHCHRRSQASSDSSASDMVSVLNSQQQQSNNNCLSNGFESRTMMSEQMRTQDLPSSPHQLCCVGQALEPLSPDYSDYHLQCNGESSSNLFLYPLAINELANLSRNELTAIGLLPPQPTCHKTKRQRPKRFHCPHCQVAFSNNGQLRGHIRIHTGERPFVCEEEGCGKSFTRNEELTRHRRIHTGLRPFPCSFCGKKFGRKDHLKKHTRTHQRVMYSPAAAMIGYGHPFQPFHPPILSSTVSSNDHLNFSSISLPSILPSMSLAHYPSTLSFE